MKVLLSFLGLFCLSFLVHAEHATPQSKPEMEIQVYTKQSAAQVEALNKGAEVLRDPSKALPIPKISDAVDNVLNKVSTKKRLPLHDPTEMSGNFRQELKKHSSPAANLNTGKNTPENTIPTIELAAKILGKNKSVMLRINNDRIIQMTEGDQLSLQENHQVIDIRVEKIDNTQVKIFVSSPLNKTLILQ